MKKIFFLLMAAGMLFACQSAQDKMNDAADKAGDAMADATDKAGDAMGDMADKAGDAMGDMADKAGDAMAKAISGSYDEIKGALGANAMTLSDNSTINWKGSKAVGAGHEGTIAFKEGMLSMSEGSISGAFTIDMTSIKNTDLDAESAAKLVGHLSSPDFFDIANNPMATLVFNNIAVGDGGSFTGNARLDLKGKTTYNEVSGNISKTDAGTMAIVNMNFDRAEHDVQYGSGKFFENLGDKLINDEVNLNGTLLFN